MTARSDGWAGFPRRRPVLSLVASIAACIVVGASGAVFTTRGLNDWYPSLTQPALAPPNWVFGPVWTALFATMGIAAWLVWRRADGSGSDAGDARLAIAVFVGHFLVNVGWSAAFFGLQSTTAGLVVIVVLWGAIVATMWLFYRVDRRAAALLVPYLAWVSFAAYLNYAFWVLN